MEGGDYSRSRGHGSGYEVNCTYLSAAKCFPGKLCKILKLSMMISLYHTSPLHRGSVFPFSST
jgi:hypothetical protein